MARQKALPIHALGMMIASCTLLAGCKSTEGQKLYPAYKAIRLGEAISKGVAFPTGAQIERKETLSEVKCGSGHALSYLTERALFVMDADGRVIGKRYQLHREQATIWLLWASGHERSEWEIMVDASFGEAPPEASEPRPDQNPNEYVESLCSRLSFSQFGLRIPGVTAPLERILRSFGQDGVRIVDRDLDLERSQRVRSFPWIEYTKWHVQRVDEYTMRICIEDRQEVSLLVWVFLGWTGMLLSDQPP